jgi:thiamine biosynthesis protein ThiI
VLGQPARWNVVVRFGELALKKGNRRWFMQKLRGNVERTLAGLPVSDITIRPNRCFVRVDDVSAWLEIRERLARVPGVKHFSLALVVRPDMEAIKEAYTILAPAEPPESFRVKVQRGDKKFPLRSPEIAVEIGQWIKDRTGARVDLRNGELTFGIDVQKEGVFTYVEQVQGPGGLPVGTAEGKVLVLLSGGIDSPVAAYRLLRRGCKVELVHFTSYPFVDRSSWDKCRTLAQHLAKYQYETRLHVIPLGEVQQRIVVAVPPKYRILMYRRMMLRVAERLAEKYRCQALVTGESLGQVGSQTLSNLTSVERVVTIPVLRPLIGMDKLEIVDEAQRLGTYETSIEADMDCCQYLVPPSVATKSTPNELADVESAFEVEELVGLALAGEETEVFRWPEGGIGKGKSEIGDG